MGAVIGKKNGVHETAYFNLIETSSLIEMKVKEALKNFGLTHPQFNILKILNGSRPTPLSASHVKERMLFKNPDVTRLIDRLVEKGFVLRRPCQENRRKVDLHISKKGEELILKATPVVKKSIHDFFKNELDANEARALNDYLTRIKQTLN